MSVELLIGGIALVAFIVSVITEATKGIYPLDQIPTSVQVLILSLIGTPLAYVIYSSINNISLEWYDYVIGFICGFIVTLVAQNGWQFVKDLWDRTNSGIK